MRAAKRPMHPQPIQPSGRPTGRQWPRRGAALTAQSRSRPSQAGSGPGIRTAVAGRPRQLMARPSKLSSQRQASPAPGFAQTDQQLCKNVPSFTSIPLKVHMHYLVESCISQIKPRIIISLRFLTLYLPQKQRTTNTMADGGGKGVEEPGKARPRRSPRRRAARETRATTETRRGEEERRRWRSVEESPVRRGV